MLETITLENAIKLSVPVATKIFNDKIAPIITSKILKFFKDKSDSINFEKQAIKYISWATGQCSTINTIAFPNTPKKLEELYLPLTIRCEDNTKLIVNDEADIFESSSKVLVNDTAGMGKSTLSKKILLNIIKNKITFLFLSS